MLPAGEHVVAMLGDNKEPGENVFGHFVYMAHIVTLFLQTWENQRASIVVVTKCSDNRK